MAREEADREDLLDEGRALVDRAAFAVAPFAEPVFIGFRWDGAASVFFGPDRVYHFNAAALQDACESRRDSPTCHSGRATTSAGPRGLVSFVPCAVCPRRT